MKRNLLILSQILLLSFVSAQEVSKNILVEHFTNTVCGICASRNPTFYNTINSYNKVVHVAFHPSSPYPTCPLNQHNLSENDARTNFYNIYGGTPRVVVNGTVIPASTSLITNATLDAQNNATTPFDITVEQYQVGNDSMYTEIVISTVAATTVTDANLVVLLSEKELNFAAQNGENVHYDVFRKFLNNTTITLPTNGSSATYTFGSVIDQEWTPTEITTTVILQESDKNVLQSKQSDKLDFTTGISLTEILEEVLYPNPVKDFLFINNEAQLVNKIEIYSIIGSLIEKVEVEDRKTVKLAVGDYEEGSYIVRVYDNDNNAYTRKIVIDY